MTNSRVFMAVIMNGSYLLHILIILRIRNFFAGLKSICFSGGCPPFLYGG